MTKVSDIAKYFSEKIPAEMKMDFDNVGLLVGIESAKVHRVLLALDITDAVLDEAAELGAELIISHHPLFFDLKRVSSAEPDGRKIIKMLQHGISALCLHTNFDGVDGGVNDALARALLVSPEGRLETLKTSDSTEYGIGRYGSLSAPMSMQDYLAHVKAALKTSGIRYHSSGRDVSRVALCGGSGGEYVQRSAALGCDTLVTADVKYHQFLLARELGINLLDADHFCTENVAMPVLLDMLTAAFPDVTAQISTVHAQTVKFF